MYDHWLHTCFQLYRYKAFPQSRLLVQVTNIQCDDRYGRVQVHLFAICFLFNSLVLFHLCFFSPFGRLKMCYHCYYHYSIINSLCSFFVKTILGQQFLTRSHFTPQGHLAKSGDILFQLRGRCYWHLQGRGQRRC